MPINFKDIHPAQYFSSDYLFGVDRIKLHLSDWIFLALGLAFVGVGIILMLASLYIAHPVTKKFLRRLFKVFMTVGVVEALWFAMRYQNAAVVGTHFVAILILLIGVLSFIPSIKYFMKKYKTEKQNWDKEQLKKKYL